MASEELAASPRQGLGSWLLVVLAALWLGGALFAPWAQSRGYLVAPFVYLFYSPICHQLTERSFEIWGAPTAACHRCVGLYAGFLVGLLLMPQLTWLRARLVKQPVWVVLFALPLVIDVSLYRHNTAMTRFTTGLIAALPLALLALLAAHQLRSRRSRNPAREQS